MNYLVIRSQDTARVTVLYKDNDLRVCRQNFAVMRSKDGRHLAVVMWENEPTEDNFFMLGEAYNHEAAANVLGAAVDKFIGFMRDKLRDELMGPPITLKTNPDGTVVLGHPNPVTRQQITQHSSHVHISMSRGFTAGPELYLD